MHIISRTCFIMILLLTVMYFCIYLVIILYENEFNISYKKYFRFIKLVETENQNKKCSFKDILPYSNSEIQYNPSGAPIRIKKLLNPPTYLSSCDRQKIKLLHSKLLKSKIATPRLEALRFVSEIFQEQLRKLQNSENCSNLNFICQHLSRCGLGCQIHQRIGCLMISYALGIPLIHDEKGWIYNESWSSVFLPIGSTCLPGNETYLFNWWSQTTPKLYRQINGVVVNEDVLEYPLENGLPVLKELAVLVELAHKHPVNWWFSQFVKFGLNLNEKMQKKLETTLLQMNFQHPIVGVHVRRTDKNTVEDSATRHDVSDYMKIADQYYEKLNKSNNGVIGFKNVFIASDDATIVNETKTRYQNWNVVGFNSRTTLASQNSREGGLIDIVLDLFLLSECDFIVCGMSSNICGVLFEISMYKNADGIARVDGTVDSHKKYYSHHWYMGHYMEDRIVKICNSD